MTPPKDQAPGLVARIKDEVMTMTDADGFTWVGIEDYADRIEQLEAERDNLSDKLELERALTDGARRRARTAEAENAELRAKLEKIEAAVMREASRIVAGKILGIKGAMSRDGIVNIVCAALTEQANIRSPVQSQIREPYEGEDEA